MRGSQTLTFSTDIGKAYTGPKGGYITFVLNHTVTGRRGGEQRNPVW